MVGSTGKVPSFDGDPSKYKSYKKDVQYWTKASDLPADRMGPILALNLSGRAREIVDQIDMEVICQEESTTRLSGPNTILSILDDYYLKPEVDDVFNRFVAFSELQRKARNMSDYLTEFNMLASSLKNDGMQISDTMLSMFMIKNAELSSEHKTMVFSLLLAKHEMNDLRVDETTQVLRQLFVDNASPSTGVSQKPSEPQVLSVSEDQEACNRVGKSRGKGKGKSKKGKQNSSFQKDWYSPDHRTMGKGKGKSKSMKSGCYNCGGHGHFASACPSPKPSIHSVGIANSAHGKIDELNGRYGVIDSACTASICSEEFLLNFENSLTDYGVTESIHRDYSDRLTFTFADGNTRKSDYVAYLPIRIGSYHLTMRVDVFQDCRTSFLICRDFLRQLEFLIDFTRGTFTSDLCGLKDYPLLRGSDDILLLPLFETPNPASHTASGCSITPDLYEVPSRTDSVDQHLSSHGCEFTPCAGEPVSTEDVHNMVLNVESNEEWRKYDSKQALTKLHKNYGHASVDKLYRILAHAGAPSSIRKHIESVVQDCEVCFEHQKPPNKPKTGGWLTNGFNDIVFMDLSEYMFENAKTIICHMIDGFTNLSYAELVPSKAAKDALNAFIGWSDKAGTFPRVLVTDGGLEFQNTILHTWCSKHDITFIATPPRTPECNGIVERRNGFLKHILDSVYSDIKREYPDLLSMPIVLKEAVRAMNSIPTKHSYSPFYAAFLQRCDPFDVTPDSSLGALSHTESMDKNVQYRLRLRELVHDSIRTSQAQEKLRAILLTKQPKLDGPFFPNERVYMYIQPNTFKRGYYYGPLRVVARNGKTYTVESGSVIQKVHENKLRLSRTIEMSPEILDSFNPHEFSHSEQLTSCPHCGIQVSVSELQTHKELFCTQTVRSAAVCFSVTTKIPSKKEISELSAEFQTASLKELNQWRALDCYERVEYDPNIHDSANIVSSRWVHAIKTDENGKVTFKSRLVARGYEDEKPNQQLAVLTSKRRFCRVRCFRSMIPKFAWTHRKMWHHY